MKFVLDASTASAAILFAAAGTYGAQVARLIAARGRPVCPCTWPAEISNALHGAYLKKRLTEGEARAALRRLQALKITVAESPAPTAVFDLQIKSAISAYDAMYVAIAKREGLKIATHDTRLAHNLTRRGLGHLLLRPADLPPAT